MLFYIKFISHFYEIHLQFKLIMRICILDAYKMAVTTGFLILDIGLQLYSNELLRFEKLYKRHYKNVKKLNYWKTLLLPSCTYVGHDMTQALVWVLRPTLYLKFRHLIINITQRKTEKRKMMQRSNCGRNHYVCMS